MTAEEFTGTCIKTLLSDDISVSFNKRKYNSKYSYNFFSTDPKRPELQINYFNNDFLIQFPIFIHEYCHYLQWKENRKKWKSYHKYGVRLDNYLQGTIKKINKNTIAKIQELESDCDQKAIRLIKEYSLPIDIKTYIKESNLYIYTYRYITKYKKFFVSYAQDLLDLMPPYMMTAEEFTIDIPSFEEKYVKYLNAK